MKIAIDLTALLPVPTGVDVSLIELVRHLARIDRVNRYTLFVNFEDRGRWNSIVSENMSLRACSSRARAMRFLFQQCFATALANSHDVLHSPSFLMPMWRGKTKHLLTVHDMTFFSMPGVHEGFRRSTP